MRSFIIVIITIFMCGHSYAQNVPYPERKQISLDSLKSSLDAQKKEQKRLKQEIKLSKKELSKLQKDLVSISEEDKKLQKSFNKLIDEKKLLEKDRDELLQRINKNKALTGKIISALIHLEQTPKEAYVFSNEMPYNIGLTQISLQHSIPNMQKDLKDFKNELRSLKTLEENLDKQESKVLQKQTELEKKRSEMKSLLIKRQKLFDENKGLLVYYSDNIAKTVEQAKTMEELLNHIQIQKPKLLTKAIKKALPATGNRTLPAAGIVKVRYGDKDNIGAKSDGLKISVTDKTVVTAPMGGVIRYTGSFKGYKNLIIIEHKNNQHSLIAGVSEIYVQAGQTVIPKEPIGIVLGHGQTGSSILYYELRRNGRPINPL